MFSVELIGMETEGAWHDALVMMVMKSSSTLPLVTKLEADAVTLKMPKKLGNKR